MPDDVQKRQYHVYRKGRSRDHQPFQHLDSHHRTVRLDAIYCSVRTAVESPEHESLLDSSCGDSHLIVVSRVCETKRMSSALTADLMDFRTSSYLTRHQRTNGRRHFGFRPRRGRTSRTLFQLSRTELRWNETTIKEYNAPIPEQKQLLT